MIRRSSPCIFFDDSNVAGYLATRVLKAVPFIFQSSAEQLMVICHMGVGSWELGVGREAIRFEVSNPHFLGSWIK